VSKNAGYATEFIKVRASHVDCKGGNIRETVQDTDTVTTDH